MPLEAVKRNCTIENKKRRTSIRAGKKTVNQKEDAGFKEQGIGDRKRV
jgi:hypothetical protein